jgi:hypothetical protein
MPKKVYTSFRDLRDSVFSSAELDTKTLNVCTVRRSYLSPADAVYDWRVGHDLLVIDQSSPFHGCTVSVLDTPVLRQHGYTDLSISYNRGLEPTALPLVKEVF